MGLTPEEIAAMDAAADQARRARWAGAFAIQGPSLNVDLATSGSAEFRKWLAAQPDDIRTSLAGYWASDIVTAPDISHDHERGAYARLKMLIAFATETHGFA